MKDICITAKNIHMRDINFTLQKHSARLKERTSATLGGDKNVLSNNSTEDNAWRDFHAVDIINFTKAPEVDLELDGLRRRRKRKQENVNTHRASCKTAGSELTNLNQDIEKVAEAQQCPQESGEMGRRTSRVRDAAVESLVYDSLQGLKRCKRKIEVSSIHEMGIDMSRVADHALNDKLGGEFEVNVSPGTALGLQRASCSIEQGKEREGTGAVKDAREKVLLSAHDEAAGTTIEALSVSRNKSRSLMSLVLKDSKGIVNVSSTDSPQSCGIVDNVRSSLHNDDENRGKFVAKVKEVSSMDQTENQKLRASLAALQRQFNALLSLAEKGSRNCGHCQSIEEAMRKVSFEFGDVNAGQVSAGKAITCEQNSACEDAHEWNSPVGSCTSGKTAVSNGNCKPQVSSLYTQQVESTLPPEDKGFDVHVRTDLNEDLEEAECHLCIELASSQSEDLDTEQMKDAFEGVQFESKRNAASERECKFENLHTQSEKNIKTVPGVLTCGDVSSEFEKSVDIFHGGVEVILGCEDLSDKNSKGGGCGNSVLTRNSWGSQCDAGNEVEDDGYIDLKCGCTSQKHGDTTGILRLYQNGKVEIQCECSLGCIKGKPMSPANFERHGGRGASKKWKETIWIVLADQKVQFSKVKGLDAFVRRYKESSRGRLRQPAPAKLPYHRDEFLQCSKCSKRRRFKRKTKEECWLFHEAFMNPAWECANYPSDSVLCCQDDEEREARQANRGCIRSRSCEGCIECVCVGCFTCRFEDCSCRLCVEYILNNK